MVLSSKEGSELLIWQLMRPVMEGFLLVCNFIL